MVGFIFPRNQGRYNHNGRSPLNGVVCARVFSDRELCVGTDPNEFQNVGIPFPVDQHEVGSQMAVPAVFELTFHLMVDVANWERRVRRQQFECFEKGLVKMAAVHATLGTFEISLELSYPFDRAHSPEPVQPSGFLSRRG